MDPSPHELRPHELPAALAGLLALGTPGPYPVVFVHAPLFLGADRFAAALAGPGIVDVPASGDLDEFRRRIAAPTGWAGTPQPAAGGGRVPIVIRGLHRGSDVLAAVLAETLREWRGAIPVLITSAASPPAPLQDLLGARIVAGTMRPLDFAAATGLDAEACDLAGGYLDAVRLGPDGFEPDPLLVAAIAELGELFPGAVELGIVVARVPGGVRIDDAATALGEDSAEIDELSAAACDLGLVRRDGEWLRTPFEIAAQALRARHDAGPIVAGAVRRLRARGDDVDAAVIVAGDPQPIAATERIRLGQLLHALADAGRYDELTRLATCLAGRPEPSVARAGRDALVRAARGQTELDPSAAAAGDADDRRTLAHTAGHVRVTPVDAIADLTGGAVLDDTVAEADGIALVHAYLGRRRAARTAHAEIVPRSAAGYALSLLAAVVVGDADAAWSPSGPPGAVPGAVPGAAESAAVDAVGAPTVTLTFRPPTAPPALDATVAALVDVAVQAHAGRFVAAAAALDVACGGVDWVRLADPAARALAAHVAAGTDPARAAALTHRTAPRDPAGAGALGANACLGRALVAGGDIAAGRTLLLEVWSEAAATGAHGLCALFAADLLDVVDDDIAALLAGHGTDLAADDALTPFVHAARAIAAHDPDALVEVAMAGVGDTYRSARLRLVAAAALAHAGRGAEASGIAMQAAAVFERLGAPLAQARAQLLAVAPSG